MGGDCLDISRNPRARGRVKPGDGHHNRWGQSHARHSKPKLHAGEHHFWVCSGNGVRTIKRSNGPGWFSFNIGRQVAGEVCRYDPIGPSQLMKLANQGVQLIYRFLKGGEMKKLLLICMACVIVSTDVWG